MRLDLSLSDFDEMMMNAGLDFLRRETPKLVIQGPHVIFIITSVIQPITDSNSLNIC